MKQPMPSFARVVWSLLLLLPGCFLLGTSYATSLVGPLLAGGALACALLILLGVRIGVSRWASATLTTLLLVLVAYLATSVGGASLVATLGDAVPRLLTAPRPIPVTGPLVAPCLLLVGVVTILVTVRLTVVGRVAVTPVVAGAVLYVAGALLSSGEGDPYGLLAVVLGLLAVIGWAMLSGPVAPRAAARGVRPVLICALPVLALVVVASSTVGRGNAFEPRTVVTPPLQQLSASSPLPQLAAWNEHPATELFRVRGDLYPLRMVTLTTYDGSSWQAATRYRPLGGFESSDLPAAQRRVRMDETITITDLAGAWLPSPGTPRAVSESQALIDPETGSVLLPTRPEQGVRYTISGDVDAPSARLLPSATVPPASEVRRYLALPELPKVLATYAEQATADVTTPYGKAKAIEKAVQGGRIFNPAAIGGSSYYRVQQFLVGAPGEPGSQAGTSEQFATAFAVLARHSGLPTRVVVGFKPGTDIGGGVRSVRGSDAFAYPEVYFTDLGWVPFSPTPEDGGFSQPEPPQEGAQPQTSQSPDTVPAPDGEVTDDGGRDLPGPDSTSATVALVLGIGGGLLVLALVGLLVARVRRRRRHRTGGAPGAWAEVLDAARLSGLHLDPHVPAPDLALVIDQRAAGGGTTAGAVRVARVAEHATFGPDLVTDDGTIWEVAVATSRSLRKRLPWWRRALWSLDPRAFRRR